MKKLTRPVLRNMWPKAPQAKIDAIVKVAPKVLAEFDITTELRLAHLMAQISHENGAGTIVRESMNYSAPRMMQIFGVGRHSAAVTEAEAEALAYKPAKIAERVYGLGNPKKAKELGNTKPGDGFRFRGNGDLQLTGRGSHERIGALIGVDLAGNPEQLEDPAISFRVACAEFNKLNCIPAADDDDVRLVTRRVNGGYNGLAEREVWLRKWKAALAVAEDEPGVATAPVPPPSEPRGGESDQPKSATKSKTLWSVLAQIGAALSSVGAALASLDWKVVAVLGGIVIVLAIFIGRERIRKLVEEGV